MSFATLVTALLRLIVGFDYFIQMCGYKNGNLRAELLDKDEGDFIRKRDDGSYDRSRYNIAAAMIALLNVGATGFNDGLYFDSSAADINQMRYVFRRLFEIKHQEQHIAVSGVSLPHRTWGGNKGSGDIP